MKKELEALKRVVSEINNYKLHGIGAENWLGIQDVLKDVNTIEKAIIKAQKQEKLLELYKEALETDFEGITLIKLVNKTLRTQIKEKENESNR